MDEFNFSAPPPASPPIDPPPEAATDTLPFRRPADYYATPGSTLRPLFPKWVPAGCGWASLVFIVLLFVAGSLAPKSGSALEWLFAKIETDMTPHFTKAVTPAQKAAFAAEMKTLRASAKAGKLKLDKTQAFLKLATEVDSDEKIDPAEADKLIAAVRDVNRTVK
ncbi:MAG TPA: hypothetical protein VHY33_13340 [Thermoanaerobaculia bacterium]|jgi:hypothetical protein|nr:hypothetical protein [Thermoanaerobaculia bacterium]